MRTRSIVLLVLLMVGMTSALPAASQGGSGVIVMGNLRGASHIGSLNPLRCHNADCRRLTDLLFPTLVAVDPVTGTYAAGTATNTALALSWEADPAQGSYSFQLREDLFWSDGVPVTAYDVFFSYLAVASGQIDSPYTDRVNMAILAAAPLDTHAILFIFTDAGCASPGDASFPIVPAHVFEADFAETAAAAFEGDGDPLERFILWSEARAAVSFSYLIGHPFDDRPTATAGLFSFAGAQPADYVRLVSNDGALGLNYVDVPDSQTLVTGFLTGAINLVENPPYRYWDDILAAGDVQVFVYPGSVWDYINLNLAEPHEPQSAFGEDGLPLPQGHHPIFGDQRVRRALQMAIDIQALIDAAVYGHGTVLPANQLPTSWAYNETLSPVAYDPMAAARLLEEAGWKDTNNDGIRECITCLYAQENARLVFELAYVESPIGYREVVANLIGVQLRQVGFDVRLRSASAGFLLELARDQRYDAILAGRGESYPVEVDLRQMFATAADILEDGGNTGSYHNAQVDVLLQEAHDLPGCAVERRADLYRQVQVILQEEQPYIWLFAPDYMIATRGGVSGFDPTPYAPFWNVRDWFVWR